MKKAIIKDPNDEVPTEILATEIIKMSESIKKLRSGRLNDRALYLLIQDGCKLPVRDIRAVFESAEDLARRYIKKKVT